MKISYIIAIILTFFLLSRCLGFNYITFGLAMVLKDGPNRSKSNPNVLHRVGYRRLLISASIFVNELHFPQKTWCLISRPKLSEFLTIRKIVTDLSSTWNFLISGSIDRTWSECVLSINGINNVVFSLFWFWLSISLLLTIVSLIYCSMKMLPSATELFLVQHLAVRGLYKLADNVAIDDFIAKCPPDVVLILRLYEVELDHVLVGEIVGEIFQLHKKDLVSN